MASTTGSFDGEVLGQNLAMPPNTDDQPQFAVLDVVVSLLPEERQREGIVTGIRRYVDGVYTFHVAPHDATDDVVGGIYGAHQLAATGQRSALSRFWTNPDWARRVVVVTDDYPDSKLHGWFGLITDEHEPGEVYGVEFISAKGWKSKTKRREIAARFLEPTEHRLPPEPIPRPTRTLHPGLGERNLRPAHEFDIIDELDQYL